MAYLRSKYTPVAISTFGDVTLTGSQTLTNKTLTSPVLTTPALGTVATGNLSNVAIVYPAGHVINFARSNYAWTGDLSIGTTSEAFGPVISFQLTKANAQLHAMYVLGDAFIASGQTGTILNVCYKSSSFTAAQGNTSHGAALLNQGRRAYNRIVAQYNTYTVISFNAHSLGNSAGDTYYFSPEGFTTSGSMYVNYAGSDGGCTLFIWEIA